MTPIYYDIETAPLPDDQLRALLPPFDPAEVKCGNLGPEKAAAKIAEAESSHWSNFKDSAALSALTGRVLVIGCAIGDEPPVILHNDDEAALLRDFWSLTTGDHGRSRPLVGFNTHLFDLPFLIRRGWHHGLQCPAGLRNGRYFRAERSIDLREEWQLGDRQAHGSLDAVSRHLGLAGKTGNGKDFAALWTSSRQEATSYALNDVELTRNLARVLRPDLFVSAINKVP